MHALILPDSLTWSTSTLNLWATFVMQLKRNFLHDPMHAYSVYWSHVYYCITPTTASPHTVIAHACHHPNSSDAPQVYSDGMPACKFNTCRGAPCVGCRVITVITAITSHAMFAHHASHAVQC